MELDTYGERQVKELVINADLLKFSKLKYNTWKDKT